MTSITKNDNSSPHKIFNRKKMLNRFYFPPTLPHSTHIRLWCRSRISNTGPPSTKTTTPAVTKYSIEKKMLNRFYFPPTLPHSTHIRLWCRAGYPT
ncbi:hypothetical protein TNCV_456541 [Trichonephila clavipes]|uniref:Uncharacterized protein n=1 Tax=Trichonephila clavipes TaxID=2585209 RepID=A0A8X6RNL8_TRICX|nr:hypothetical protein TNCV_456541 [Trichonephila clavipes]